MSHLLELFLNTNKNQNFDEEYTMQNIRKLIKMNGMNTGVIFIKRL